MSAPRWLLRLLRGRSAQAERPVEIRAVGIHTLVEDFPRWRFGKVRDIPVILEGREVGYARELVQMCRAIGNDDDYVALLPHPNPGMSIGGATRSACVLLGWNNILNALMLLKTQDRWEEMGVIPPTVEDNDDE